MEKGKRRIPELISIAQKLGITVLSVNLREPSLEDVFLHFTGKTMRENLKEIMVAPVDRVSIVLGRIAGGSTTAVIQGILVLFRGLV